MIKKYHQFILEKKNIEQTNEGLKDWVAAFLMLANVGVVPLNVTTANAQTKKAFVENQPQDKIDAAKFVDFINKSGGNNPINKIWTDFITQNKDVKSKFNDVEKYINKDGKTYHFDKKYQQQDFSNVDIHNFTPVNYLTDMGNFIEDSQEPTINNFIYDYEKQTSVEICVVTVPSLNGEDPFQYSLGEFNRIGVGKEASDNGILIMVSMQDRKWRIVTGYGVEGVLPDVTCSHIGNDIIKPNFKKGDYYAGIMGALNEIKSVVNKNPEDIKKFKQELEFKSAAEAKEFWTNFGYGALMLVIIGTLSKLIYNKWKKNDDLVDDIEERLRLAEEIKELSNVKGGNSGVQEIDELYTKFKNVVNSNILTASKLSAPVEKPKFYQIGKQDKFIEEQGKRAKELEDIYNSVRKVYDNWESKKERLENIKSSISGFNVAGLLSAIEMGYRAYTELQNVYGVNARFDKESLKSRVDKLSDLVKNAESAYKTSISDAESILSKVSSKSITSETQGVMSILSRYKSDESKLKGWESILDQAIKTMLYYKHWAKRGEEQPAYNAVDRFKSIIKNGYDRKDMSPMLDELESTLSDISEVELLWKRRKEEEEEEERRKRRKEEEERRRKREEEEEEDRRRRNSYSSSSSWSSSSSDSGSSFGGFGGGGSGGGGAGGDW